MRTELNMLIVDDHPMTVNGYINVLSEEDFDFEILFNKALDCEEAYNLILEKKKENKKLDIAFLDLSLPPYEEKNILSGADLGKLIRESFHQCLVIILTMHSEVNLIEELIEKINPEGILCKSDIDIDEFLHAFNTIIAGEQYYSHKIEKALKDKTINSYNLDLYDRQILMRLSEGILTQNIPNYVPLPLNDIERRKAHLKHLLLEGKDGDDDEFVEKIKRIGII